MYRKEVTYSDGRYERKSRGRKLADEMGRGKKKSHYTLIDWRTGRGWPLNWMTVISARWRPHRPFQRKRKWHIPVARYRKKLRRRVHITAWEFEGNIRPTNWTEDSWVPVSWVRRASTDRRVELRRSSIVADGHRRDVLGKASNPESGLQDSAWAAMENENDTTLKAITSGSKYFSNVRSPAHSHTQTLNNPFRKLTNKVRGKYFIKKSSCVFLCASFIPVSLSSGVLLLHRYVSSIYMYISAWISRWLYNIQTVI